MKKPFLALSLALIVAAAASAEPVEGGFRLEQNLMAAYNPVGLSLGTRLLYRIPLDEGSGILWESAKLDVGVQNSLTPAYDFSGVFIDLEPIALFDLALSAQATGYFDGLGYGFRELSGYNAPYKSSALDELKSKNAGGYLLSAAPTLKFAFGPFAFSNTLHLNYFDVDGGEGYFFETFADCALRKRDLELYNDAYALVTATPWLRLGLNAAALYVPGSGYRSQTLQLIGVATSRLSPTVDLQAALAAGLYTEDRYYRFEPRVSGMVGIGTRL